MIKLELVLKQTLQSAMQLTRKNKRSLVRANNGSHVHYKMLKFITNKSFEIKFIDTPLSDI